MKKNCREISEDKIAVRKRTAGLRSENFLDLDSACFKVLVPVTIFQNKGMHSENRFLDTFRGHNIRSTKSKMTLKLNKVSVTNKETKTKMKF